ncbi:MAG: hypothetical protein ABIQ04_02270 [Candidatus Saccharimonadales bacterium]
MSRRVEPGSGEFYLTLDSDESLGHIFIKELIEPAREKAMRRKGFIVMSATDSGDMTRHTYTFHDMTNLQLNGKVHIISREIEAHNDPVPDVELNCIREQMLELDTPPKNRLYKYSSDEITVNSLACCDVHFFIEREYIADPVSSAFYVHTSFGYEINGETIFIDSPFEIHDVDSMEPEKAHELDLIDEYMNYTIDAARLKEVSEALLVMGLCSIEDIARFKSRLA